MLWHIVRWEVTRHLRNKQFLIGLFATPIIIALFAGVPFLLERIDNPQQRTYYVVDKLAALPLLQSFVPDSAVTLQQHSTDEGALRQAVLDEVVDGYFILDEQFVTTGTVAVYTNKHRPFPDGLDAALTALLQALRLQQQRIEPEVLSYVSAKARLQGVALSASDEDAFFGSIGTASVFAFLLFFLIVGSGSMLLQSAVQEKRDRMSEVVLSSVSPDTFMTGKIVGHFILGAIQIGFWLALGLPIVHFVLNLPVTDYIAVGQLPVLAWRQNCFASVCSCTVKTRRSKKYGDGCAIQCEAMELARAYKARAFIVGLLLRVC